jgi:hypothetical protein
MESKYIIIQDIGIPRDDPHWNLLMYMAIYCHSKMAAEDIYKDMADFFGMEYNTIKNYVSRSLKKAKFKGVKDYLERIENYGK